MPLFPFRIDVEGYKRGAHTAARDAKRPGGASPAVGEQGAEGDDSPILRELKRLYSQYFVQEYEPKLTNVNNTKPIYPTFGVFIDEEGYDVKFDFDFFEQLFDIYILEGWAGVVALQCAVTLLASNSETRRAAIAAGTRWPVEFAPYDERAWQTASALFFVSRNMLAILITATLQKIEELAAEQILQKLSFINVQISKGWATYQIKETKSYSPGSSGSWDTPDVPKNRERTSYSIGDKPLAADLYELLTKVVDETNNFNTYARSSAAFRKLKTHAMAASKAATWQPAKRKRLLKAAARSETQEIKYKSLTEATRSLLTRLNLCISTQHPFGLVILNFLEKGFDQPHMEHVLGLTLNELRIDLEKLAAQISPTSNRVGQIVSIAGLQSSNLTIDQVLSFSVPDQGIELSAIDYSLYKYKNPDSGARAVDLSFLPLLSEENLTRILDEEVIEFDTFEYVVATHYVRALLLRLAAIEDEEAVWENFWKSIAKVSAALSLASLATPVTTEFAPFLRGASVVADLAMLAHAVNSITANLQRSENLMAQNLVAINDEFSELYAQLGEVLVMKKEFAEGMNELLAQEFFSLLIGQRLPIIKEVLLARSYYYDLETLSEEL